MTPSPARWLVAGLAAVSLTLTLTWVGLRDRDSEMLADPPPPGSPTARFSGGPIVESLARPAEMAPMAAAPPGSPPFVAVLRDWDRRRARAFARGDAEALRRLYAMPSRAGAADVALMQDYQRRGLRVERLRMQLLAVEVLDHAPGHWRLRVTDRVASAVVVGNRSEVTLPRDTASTQVVTLRRNSAGELWQVTAVTRP